MSNQKTNKNRKYGRQRGSAQNAAYKAQSRKYKNKVRKLTKYCLHNPNDLQAQRALKSISSNREWGARK